MYSVPPDKYIRQGLFSGYLSIWSQHCSTLLGLDLTSGPRFATVGLLLTGGPTRILALVNLTSCESMCRSFELAQGFAMLNFQLPEVYGASRPDLGMSSDSRCD